MDLTGILVLLVDDHAETRQLLTVVLERCGATVRAVASARGGVMACDEAVPDVVVSDLAMPDHDGYTFLRALRLRSACARVRAIAVTGHAHHRARAIAAGFDDFLVKPVPPSVLCERVARHAHEGRRDASRAAPSLDADRGSDTQTGRFMRRAGDNPGRRDLTSPSAPACSDEPPSATRPSPPSP